MSPKFELLQPADFTPEVMREVIELGMKSGTWKDDDRDYYKEQFLNPKNINIVCRNEDGQIVGYILARPHNDVVQDYLELDYMMKASDVPMFYVDHVNINEIVFGRSLGLKLIDEMIHEAHRRGVEKFSMHCRVINGLSKIIQRKYGDGLKVKRRIECYADCNDEPFDYMEIVVPF